MLEAIRDRDALTANANSRTSAYLIRQVMGAMGSKAEVNIADLLPYPPDDGNNLTMSTAKALDRLMEQKALPPQVIASMGKYIDQMERLLD